jgi:hypothetical protein
MKSNYYKLKALVLTMTAIFLLIGTAYSQGKATRSENDKHGPAVVLPIEPEGSSRAIGDDCTTPIVIGSMPYTDVNTTTGRLNNYDATCMGIYDGGEDIIYQFTLTSASTITAILDPMGNTYSGIAIMDACPMSGTCLAYAGNSGTAVRTISAVLTPGTYFIMIDTYPAPYDIPQFTLNVTATPPPPLLANYGFLQTNETYSEITGGLLLGNESVDDQYYVDPATPTGGATVTGPGLDIGFPFVYNEATYDRFGVSTNGWISLGQSTLATPVDLTTGDYLSPLATVSTLRPLISGLGFDLLGHTGGTIRTETIGTAPNRVCVIQWKDYARYDYTTNDNINFQIRLYETTNEVKFVYGNFSTTSADAGKTAQVGISIGTPTIYQNRQSAGGWSNTLNGTSNVSNVLFNNALFPTSGLTFTYKTMTPMAAQYISPANGGVDIPLEASLVWAASNTQGAIPTGYRVYFGTDNPPTNIANGVSVVSPTIYTPAAPLTVNTVYNWQVVPFNTLGDSPSNPVNSFTTTLGIGTLQGFVTNSFGIPLGGASIVLSNAMNNYIAISAADGTYSFTDINSGTYTATVTLPTYNTNVMSVFVAPSVTTYQNFIMTRPSMAVTPNPYNVSLNPNEQVNGALNVNNNGDGILGWTATVNYTSPGPNTWLTLGQTTGSVNPYTNFDMPVVFNASGLTTGTIKTAEITFTSTPNVGTVVIPVTMTVSGTALNSPADLTAVLGDPINGVVNLSWSFQTTPGLQYFLIRRDGVQVGTTTNMTFANTLPAYGVYSYTVQAVFADGNSVPAGPVSIEWSNPVLALDPTSLYNEQYPMTSENVSFRIYNNGEGTLAYSFPEYLDNRGAGGPDGFGYEWIDSDEPGGPAYAWTDIAATGTAITGFSDDNVLGPFPIGFEFPFYENTYNSINVSSNGYLVLGNTSSAYSNADIPNTGTPNNMIAWFWNDLTGGGNVYYQNMGDHWIIQFNNYPDLSATGTITAQVHLYQNGDIKYFYNTISSGMTINSSTIGIENASGTIGTKINYNSAYVHNSLAVTIKYPVYSFITAVNPAQGQVPAGGFVDVQATFTSNEDYPVGTHTVDLELNTNDLNNEVVMIPATMVVYEPGMITGTVTSAADGSPIFGASVIAGTYNTMTDENGNYSIVADAGTYTMTFSKTGFSSQTVTGVVVTETQTTVVDAVLEEGFYPPTLVNAVVNDLDTQTDVTWGVPTPDYEILFDDGSAENYTAWALAGNMNAVKFTPAGYPATVYGGKIYVGDGSFPNNNTGFIGTTFGAMVMDASGASGMPGVVLDSIEVTVNNYGWVEFSGLNATIESGSFYLVMVQGAASPNVAGVGVDQTTPTSYRSYSRNVVAGGAWGLSPYQDMMIRALVSGPASDDAARVASTDVRVPVKQRGMISLHPATAQSGAEGQGSYLAVQGQSSRAVTSYAIWRILLADPNAGVQSGVQTLLNDNVPVTNYNDAAFGPLPEGWYAYAVAANYTNGGVSQKAYSNIVGHKKLVTVTANVSLTTGGSPEGAVVVLTGVDYPYSVYSQTVPAEGTVIFEDVWKGNYNILASKVGFDDYTIQANITSNRTFNIVLAETKYAPTNLYVDPLTLVATWRAPMAIKISEDFEGAVFPPAGWSSYTQNTNGWYAGTAGSSSFVIPPHTTFAVANDDEANGDGCCDYLWTPVQDLTDSESYVVRFQSYFDGSYGQTSYVEISTDNGASWTVVQTMAAATTWQEIEVDLTAYAGPSGLSSAVIGFHTNDNGAWASGWAIDDVRLMHGVNPAMGYGVFLDGTLVANTPETTYTYTNLNYGQEYLAGVAALFSSGYSEMSTYLFRSLYLIPPTNLQGTHPAGTDYAHLTWEAPTGGSGAGGSLFEDFETGVLSEGWEIIQTNTNSGATPCYWTVNDYVSADFAPFGLYHAGLWWDYDHQDEWLITPEVECGAGTTLTFETTVYEGSTNGDHYYVKISTDGGETWTPVWDASTLTGNGWNYYDYNYSIDLSDFAGESIKVAFNAVDGDGAGLWYIWFVDNIGIATATDAVNFHGTDLTRVSHSNNSASRGHDQIARDGKTQRVSNLARNNRAVTGLIGYNIYRDNAKVGYVAHPTLEYFDLNLDPAVYSYHITAVYDLTPYGYAGQTGESMIEGPIDVNVIYGYDLPFVEEFTSGTFTTNDWTIDGANWHIAGQAGNPAPAAEFTYSPVQTDYSLALTSSWINGYGLDSLGYVDGDIYLDFDLKLDDNTATGDEKLKVEVYNGSAWVTAANITAEGDMDWDLHHVKITNSAKNKVFRVRFVANGANSLDINNWQIDNINIYRLCAAPTNLVVTIPDKVNHGDQILLEWEGPSTPTTISGWLKWDDGTNAGNGVGLTSGGTFLAASRFTPEQLTAWAGTSLTKIRLFPYAASGCTFVLKVWTGAGAGTLVASQPITFTSDQWNEYSLDAPIYVSGTTELWFGYEVTHAAGQYPGGADAGPAVAGYGDMISTDGATWDPMSTFGLDYNWNLEGFVETLDGATQLLQPIVNNTVYNNSSSTLAMSPVSNVNNPNATVTTTTSSSRAFTGYNIYRDDTFIATTTETSYLDTDPAISILGREFCYKVNAVYEDCESDYTNTGCETVVDAQNIELGAVNVYPNPSNNVVNIEVTNDINQVVIYNYAGQVVYQQMITKDKNIQIDVRNYNAGAYLVKFITRSGESFAKKVAVTK